MPKLVQFGAGNIGRSFIGQLFARAGYEVVFVDIDRRVLEALNRQRRYRVVIKQTGQPDKVLWIENVRGVDGRKPEAVAEELAEADIAATAVGARALDAVIPLLAEGLRQRWKRYPQRALDVILAENLHAAAAYLRERLRKALPEEYPLEELVGLVESSIGKMVPIMPEEERAKDPLLVFAEPYNTLILDKKGFRNTVPPVPGLAPKENMKAWVDRKLYLHNLGHACAAYFGFEAAPERVYVYEVLAEKNVREQTRKAMYEAAAILHREYPADLPEDDLAEHVEDLLRRFANQALGDTVYRVGRDLYRKLGKQDRLVGAMLLGLKHGCPIETIGRGYLAGTRFQGRDEQGRLLPEDKRFHELERPQGLEHILKKVSGLSPAVPLEQALMDMLMNLRLKAGKDKGKG